jgi:cytochrome P450
MAKVFTQNTVEQIKSITPKLANQLIDNIISKKKIDLLKDYANPLSTLVMCDMLGIPIEDTNYFLPQEEVSNRLYPSNELPAGLYGDANAYIKFLNDYFGGMCAQRRVEAGDDPISLLIRAYDEEQKNVTDDYLVSNIFLLFSARENTYIGMTTLLLHLYQNPSQLELLKNNFGLINNAIDEALRFDPPLQISSPLIVTQDVELESGFKIKQGKFVLAHLGSASHDEDVFKNPECFDIVQQRKSGVHFGRGFHFCIGSVIARAMIEIALKVLFERLPHLQIENPDDPIWCPRFSIRGLYELKAII